MYGFYETVVLKFHRFIKPVRPTRIPTRQKHADPSRTTGRNLQRPSWSPTPVVAPLFPISAPGDARETVDDGPIPWADPYTVRFLKMHWLTMHNAHFSLDSAVHRLVKHDHEFGGDGDRALKLLADIRSSSNDTLPVQNLPSSSSAPPSQLISLKKYLLEQIADLRARKQILVADDDIVAYVRHEEAVARGEIIDVDDPDDIYSLVLRSRIFCGGYINNEKLNQSEYLNDGNG
ncbi:hypothetical protein B0H14DRAFT_2559581 [Mycena olivaceomarginata]|nr:hypothetical protein B0H14DRAFT_2559581 [Mycena olivaceomarginata]